MEKEKLKEILSKVKDFNLTSYLLTRKEHKLLKCVELREGEIDFYKGRIILMKSNIAEFEDAIIENEKIIKSLNSDIAKIQKVMKI